MFHTQVIYQVAFDCEIKYRSFYNNEVKHLPKLELVYSPNHVVLINLNYLNEN